MIALIHNHMTNEDNPEIEASSGPLSPSRTRALLTQLGHHPRKALGQNFLTDGNLVRKSLQLGQVSAADAIVEIGPGLGTLTTALLETGARVYAIERDPRLAGWLRSQVVPLYAERFMLLEGDALDHPLAGWSEGGGEVKIIANLPYAISTPWLEAVLTSPTLPIRMVLMLQRETADRFLADPGTKHFGAIRIFLDSTYQLDQLHPVAARSFFPIPDIDSALLSLVRRPDPFLFPKELRVLIRKIFTQRRKQLGGLIRQAAPQFEIEPWVADLEAAGYSLTSRAEAIPTVLWQKLAHHWA